jgi:hypothetical protein
VCAARPLIQNSADSRELQLLQSCGPSFSTMEAGIAEYNPLCEGDFSDALAVVVGDGSVSCDAAG